MGSQSVTNFSAVRMKEISRKVKNYYSTPTARTNAEAEAIGAAAVGTLGTVAPARAAGKNKGGGVAGGAGVVSPRNEFMQALTSERIARAIGLIKTLAQELEEAKDPETVYEKYRITDKRPLTEVSALLTNSLSHDLGSKAETELGFAAKDAIAKTIIDVVTRAYPRVSEPANVDRQKFAKAFTTLTSEEIGTVFLENAASALVNLVLDATRGEISPQRLEKLKQHVRETFVPQLVEQLTTGRSKK